MFYAAYIKEIVIIVQLSTKGVIVLCTVCNLRIGVEKFNIKDGDKIPSLTMVKQGKQVCF